MIYIENQLKNTNKIYKENQLKAKKDFFPLDNEDKNLFINLL